MENASLDFDLVAFDLDDTLAPSKSALPDSMAAALRKLLDRAEVAVISGGAFSQFSKQLLGNLNATPAQLSRLHLMPTCGTQYLRYEDGSLVEVYALPLDDDQKGRAISALTSVAKEMGIWEPNPFGEIIEDRGSQITYSALGQKAPLSVKREWDPDGSKKNELTHRVAALLPDLEVRSGGSTSVDITAQGVDKAFGMSRLEQITNIPRERTLFIGDRLDPAGNDYPVLAAGWPTRAVDGWEETVTVVQNLLDGTKE